MRTGRGAAPGKIILLGEHAVVYGRTAIVAALDRQVRVSVTLESRKRAQRHDCGEGSIGESAPFSLSLSAPIETEPSPESLRLREACLLAGRLCAIDAKVSEVSVDADLPVAVGLGSSAALSVALLRALSAAGGRELDDAALCRAAFEIEKLFHGLPSGIDNTAATYGGFLAFQRGAAHRALRAACELPLVVAIGRRPRQTQTAVRGLRERWQLDRERHEAWFDEIDGLVRCAEEAITRGDIGKLGPLLNDNQRLLQQLGVSTDELETMVGVARRHGAIGAKLTGGGGGGAVICLCPDERDDVLRAFTDRGWNAFAANIHPPSRGDHATHSRNRSCSDHSLRAEARS